MRPAPRCGQVVALRVVVCGPEIGRGLAQKFGRLSVLAVTGVMDAGEIGSGQKKLSSSPLTGWAQLLGRGTTDDSLLESVKAVYGALPKRRPQWLPLDRHKSSS